jgi:NADPH-dependent 7-cyano-7-deazaguanine reductase QueF
MLAESNTNGLEGSTTLSAPTPRTTIEVNSSSTKMVCADAAITMAVTACEIMAICAIANLPDSGDAFY